MNYFDLNDESKSAKLFLRICGFDDVYRSMLEACLCPPFFLTDEEASLVIAEEGSLKRSPSDAPVIIIGTGEGQGRNQVLLKRPVDIAELRSLAMSLACPAGLFNMLPSTDYVQSEADFTVSLGKRSIALTDLEYRLFSLLNERIGEAVGRREIMDRLWPESDETNICDVYICYLRKKLERLSGKGSLVSVRGVGYMLIPPK